MVKHGPDEFTKLVRDVTSRAELEKGLRRYEHILSTTKDMIALVRSDFTYEVTNEAYGRALGLTAGEITGRLMTDVLGLETFTRVVKPRAERCLAGEAITFEAWFDYPVTGRRFMSVAYDPYRDPSGKVQGIVVLARDITTRKETEAALEASEEQFRSLVQHLRVVPWRFDLTENRFTFVGDQSEEIFGYPSSSWTDMDSWSQRIFAEDRNSAINFCMASSERGEDHEFEYRAVTSTGDIIWVHDIVRVTSDESGVPRELIGLMLDITRRKGMEESLRISEERYQQLSGMTSDFVFRTTFVGQSETELEWISDGFTRLTGYSLDEVRTHKQLTAFVHPEDIEAFEGNNRRLVGGKTVDFQYRIITKTGDTRWVRLYGRPEWDETGTKVVAALGAVRDVTKRKEAEEGLHVLGTAIEQGPATVVITDADGIIQYVNQRFCDVTGYSSSEVIGRKPSLLKGGNTPPEVYSDLWETVLSGSSWHGEFQNKKKSGELYWESGSVSSVVNERGEITHLLSVREETTERKLLELAKTELEQQVRRSQKLETIGTLAAGIAHDFNNILTPILGYTELAIGEANPESKLREDLSKVMEAAGRARDLVDRILLFSRQTEQERKSVDIPSLAKEALSLVRASIPSTITIKDYIDADCARVLADGTQIHEVLVNLCTNASQAMKGPKGVLTIIVEQVTVERSLTESNPSLREGDYVSIAVEDTGVGMTPAIKERIFEPFFTTRRSENGTGMGLAVVHGIVRNHDGDITVKSEPGMGSTFTVYLPVSDEILETGEAIKPRKTPGAGESILIVDDDPTVADVVAKMVRKLGYNAFPTANARDALSELKTNPYQHDLVISDLTMPDLTGAELAEQVNQFALHIPVLIMTGYGESLDRHAHSIKKVIAKPVTLSALSAAIREVLANND